MTQMDIFPWHARFATGIEVIDVQHRRLVELLNRLASQAASPLSIGALSQILDELTEYASYHFETEESIWREFLPDDPLTHEHHLSHRSFESEVRALQQGTDTLLVEEVTERTLAFLTGWLISHILESDRYMACLVSARERGLTGEAAQAHARECMGSAGQDLSDIVLAIYAAHSQGTLRLIREVQAHRQAEQALALVRSRLMNILDGTNAVVYVSGMNTHEVLFVNALGRRVLGDVVGKICWQTIQQDMNGPCSFCTNSRLLGAEGLPTAPVVWEHFNPRLNRWYQLHDQAIPWDDGRYVRLEIALDITEQKRLEQSLRDSEERYRLIFEQSRDALMIAEPPDWRFTAVNPAMLELFGAASFDDVRVLTPIDLSPPTQPDGRPSSECAWELIDIAMREGTWYGEWTHRRLDGRDMTCTLLLTRTVIAGRAVIQGTVRDITEQKMQQQQLERIAHYDPLTGLPNRVLLADRLHQALANSQRHGTMVAVAYLDLDGFKEVNDRYGHDSGDRLLVAIANRMRHALRETDTLARLGGDEFVAVLVDLDSPDACMPLLTRLLDAASAEVSVKDVPLVVSASVGVTFYPQRVPIDPDQLLRQADHAMYQAKLAGKNQYRVFDAGRETPLVSL